VVGTDEGDAAGGDIVPQQFDLAGPDRRIDLHLGAEFRAVDFGVEPEIVDAEFAGGAIAIGR
jgi:hypothetical protein